MQKKLDKNIKNSLSYGYLKKILSLARKNYRRTKIPAIQPKLNFFLSSFFCKCELFTHIMEFRNKKVGAHFFIGDLLWHSAWNCNFPETMF